MIRELRREVTAAMTDGAPGPLRFELGPIEVEATVTVTRAAGAGGTVRFLVVEAGVDGRSEASHTHRIHVTLQPTLLAPDGTRRAVFVKGDEVAGER